MIENDNSISFLNKEQCFGCRSCEQVCPRKCITIKADNEGFLYPCVDKTSCLQCGLCKVHCPNILKIDENTNSSYFGLRLKNQKELMESTSGGVFAALADYIIENGGYVFGCAFDESLKARHICVKARDDLKSIKKSKYVASDTLHTYKEVADILKYEHDKMVLYTGSPCQVHGLYAFLGNKPKNLFTADIVCHGVPSQKLFDKYVEWLSKKYKEKIVYYDFRDKDVFGWSCVGNAKTKSKSDVINGTLDPYYSSFLRGETYRLSCYKCKYANINHRPADISMGDFWGIEFVHPKFYSKRGVSCCILNTQKGKDFFDIVKERFDYIETTSDKIIACNKNLLMPTEKPNKREYIYNGIDELPINVFIKNLYAPFNKRFIRYIVSKIPHFLKVYVKKLLNWSNR